mmetsp:Transcript_4340/g.17786  ORF Transcript_4340/g.17786 Transcript_4340/m.17786 type:complete len:211 (-) Transcript_4340:1295-1927(-)
MPGQAASRDDLSAHRSRRQGREQDSAQRGAQQAGAKLPGLRVEGRERGRRQEGARGHHGTLQEKRLVGCQNGEPRRRRVSTSEPEDPRGGLEVLPRAGRGRGDCRGGGGRQRRRRRRRAEAQDGRRNSRRDEQRGEQGGRVQSVQQGREPHQGKEAGQAQAPDGVHTQSRTARGGQQRRSSIRRDATGERSAGFRRAPLRPPAERQRAKV